MPSVTATCLAGYATWVANAAHLGRYGLDAASDRSNDRNTLSKAST